MQLEDWAVGLAGAGCLGQDCPQMNQRPGILIGVSVWAANDVY